MYIERLGPGERPIWARIGRVSFSKTGKTLYYAGRTLAGEGRGRYRDVESGDRYYIQNAHARGGDRGGNNPGSLPTEIDDDVRLEYWRDIRGEPARSHERVIHV